MTSSLRATVGALAVAALIALAAGLQHARETRFPIAADTSEELYVTSGSTARRLSVGYRALAADLYWIRAIQYFGSTKLRLADETGAASAPGAPRDYRLLYPLLDLTTDLDPYFNIAYRFGSIFLAEPSPGGADRPDLAIKLLEKGLAARPDKWEYMQDIGFVHYWWRHDYAEAARWFNRAADVPGAPWFLRSLAATTLAEGGDRQSSRTMWQAIRESAEIEWLRNDADRRLTQLDAMDLIEAVQRAVNRVKTDGADASSWESLLQARVLREIPRDPAGVPLTLDAGVVDLSPASPLWPLPDEPQRAFAPPQ